mgnify:FL=1
MKVRLISAPIALEQGTKLESSPGQNSHAPLVPPLGMLMLAAALREAGVVASLVDLTRLRAEYLDGEGGKRVESFRDYAARVIAAEPADLYGFSTLCSSYPLTVRIAQAVKEERRWATVAFGGPQATLTDAETLEAFPFVDWVVRGEAEITIVELVKAGSPGGVAGLSYRAGGRTVRNQDAPLVMDLDHLPYPAFDLLSTFQSKRLHVEAGRGCPFQCSFCATSRFFRRRFRMKSAKRLVDEMVAMHQAYGTQKFDLVHDLFTADSKRVLAFCDALQRSGIRCRWTCSARADGLRPEILAAMAQAGCASIYLGVETGSPRMQKAIRKRLDLKKVDAALDLCEQLEMGTTVSFIVGFPEEEQSDLELTGRCVVNALRRDRCRTQVHLLMPLAGTEISANAASSRFSGSCLVVDAEATG